MEKRPERQVAMKIRLRDLAEGTYVKVSGEWEPNFVQTPDGRKFSRVNIIAVVATESLPDMGYTSFVVDDGTASITVRIFEDLKTDIKPGDFVLIIGRPREFNQQKYLVPEIVKKIEDKRWVEHRKLELASLPDCKVDNVTETATENVIDKVLAAISDLDEGDGADIDSVIEKSGIPNCEKIIDSLMKEGEIFEISSGRVKVLE